MATRGLRAPEWGEGAQPLGEKTFPFCHAGVFLLFCCRKAQVHAANTGTFTLDPSFRIFSDVMILKTWKFSSLAEIPVEVM